VIPIANDEPMVVLVHGIDQPALPDLPDTDR
jgi:hypothetical protein